MCQRERWVAYIVRSHLDWRGEQNIPHKSVETSSYQTLFKTVRLAAIRNGPKQTTFASCGLEWLQMVSELDMGGVRARMLGPQRGWIVRGEETFLHLPIGYIRVKTNNTC